jgi:hypothetical protein
MNDADLGEEALLDEARAKTGLDDFGDPSFREGLGALLELYDLPGGLTARGRRSQRRRLLGLLENRLRVAEAFRRRPEIRERAITRPLFLTGLPRTGTSALFNLLGSDPASRPLLLWEGNHPDPLEGADPRGEDPRLVALREALARAHQRNPEFAKIHRARADGPEECVQLLAHSMGFVQLGVEPMLSPYREHFFAEDRAPVYRYYADLLRLLDFQRPGARWLLKTPAHLWALEHLAALFPDACVVVTHRDPLECVPSYCSMMLALMGDYDAVDPEALGPVVLEYLARSMEHATAARSRLPSSMFVDVRYADFVRDPAGTARTIYDAFGLPMTEEVGARLAAHVAAHPQNEHGRHAYDLARFGLAEAEVLDRLRAYTTRYDVLTRT